MPRLTPTWLLVLLALTCGALARAQPADDPIVFESKEVTLRRSDYRQGVLEQLGDHAEARAQAERPSAFFMRQILRDRVLLEHGRKLGLDRAPEVLALPAEKRSWDIRRRAAEDLQRTVKVSEKRLRALYEEQKPELERVQVRHLLVGFKGTRFDKDGYTRDEAREAAEQAHADIAAGEADLAELASEFSHHTASAKKDGLVEFRRGSVDPKLEEVAFSAPIGKLLPVLETSLGFHVLRVEKRGAPPFEELRADLEKTERAVQFDRLLDDTIKSWRPKYAPGYEPLEGW